MRARLRAAAEDVLDWDWDGHGNCPFNTAYAAAQAYKGYAARLTGPDRAEVYMATDLPVIVSIARG